MIHSVIIRSLYREFIYKGDFNHPGSSSQANSMVDMGREPSEPCSSIASTFFLHQIISHCEVNVSVFLIYSPYLKASYIINNR